MDEALKKLLTYYLGVSALVIFELILSWGVLNLLDESLRPFYTLNFGYDDIINPGLYGGQADIITFLFGLIFGFFILFVVTLLDEIFLNSLFLEGISLLDSIIAVSLFISLIFVFEIALTSLILIVVLFYFSTKKGMEILKNYIYYEEEIE